MKLRVKATNETIPVADDSYICGLRPNGDEVEFLVSDVELIPDGWDSFRREAAKDFIAANMVQNGQDFYNPRCHPDIVERAINLADELIKQLQEEKK